MKPVGIPDVNLQARLIRRCHLVEIQAGPGSSTFYRFTDNNTGSVAVIIETVLRTFVRQFFTLSNIVTTNDEEQNTEIIFTDINQVIKAIAYSSDMRDWPVRIWECYFDPTNDAIVGTEELISGFADGLVLSEAGEESRATLAVLSSRLPEQGTGPRQEYGGNCRFRYKDEQCAATSLLPDCARTLPACIERNNQPRYGGFPYAPSPGMKFTWGPNPQVVNARLLG